MAENKLTPEVDIACRKFLKVVAETPGLFKETPSNRKIVMGCLLSALNYTWLPNGAFVEKGKTGVQRFGQPADYSDVPDEWEADEEKALAAINNKDTTEASTSSETTDTEVREAVLPEDV